MKSFIVSGWPNHFQKCALLFSASLALVFAFVSTHGQTKNPASAPIARVFCGSSPYDEPIRKILGISTNASKDIPELMEWKLTLRRDAATRAPTSYTLRCDYGVTVPNSPGIGRSIATIEREGKWSIKTGIKSNPRAVTYELDGTFSMCEINSNILQILNSDRSLLIGNGGWSYTLNATEPAEAPVDPVLARTVPDMSYPISPMAAASSVYGVFEGRTPCLGIARELTIPVPDSATKAKWRVTLHQNPETRAPTTYKIEGTLFRTAAREGKWTISRGSKSDPDATVYELTSANAEPLLLLKGDDNVLFFLDHNRTPMVGHCEFSYTLNRRTASVAVTQAP